MSNLLILSFIKRKNIICTNCSSEKFFPKLWNLLPTDIQESKTLSAFVIRIKKCYDIILLPNFTHGEDLKFTVIHCMLRIGHLPLNTNTYSNAFENEPVEKLKLLNICC